MKQVRTLLTQLSRRRKTVVTTQCNLQCNYSNDYYGDQVCHPLVKGEIKKGD
ncbi:hypothetical protein HUF18_05725 [Thalassolituus sp. ST750PaO-4]|uniref:hypothetical protein n=1 Tax=Thalassolituus sp. ST750PaO-4 TaxID=2742965 RepID=UPI001CE36195|nr:hypothetical protein [Thalassolituus sp. ST750PaO-4]MCA6059269.1 hypothetical protein [Thalassolituus sp. ST750PaO-4]